MDTVIPRLRKVFTPFQSSQLPRIGSRSSPPDDSAYKPVSGGWGISLPPAENRQVTDCKTRRMVPRGGTGPRSVVRTRHRHEDF